MPTVLITGANKGFGRELVDVYTAGGWTVFPLVRRKAEDQRLVSEYPSRCIPIIGDVSSDSIASTITDLLEKHTSSLDLLINNAGIIRKKRGLADVTSGDLIDHFNVHCIGALRCTKASLPFLKKSPRPIVVNITSRWGSIGRTVAGHGGLIYSYQIAKAAQNMLTACLSQELKADNIIVFAIHPGRLKTSVAAPDADIDPSQAAQRLYEWLENVDESYACHYYDLISGDILDW